MAHLLVVKTANGYMVMPYPNQLPTVAPELVKVATRLNDSYGADSVQGAIREHFEPKAE
jgi:hypothetical protein